MDNLMMLDGVLDRDQLQALEQAPVWHTDAVWTLGLRLTDDSDGTTTADKIDLIRRATPQEILAGAAHKVRQIFAKNSTCNAGS